ncbi:MAG: lytic transglycosylase domain-containing protein [Prevotellaceae bacterium]|nr:lytic transglycosylase domain-containing protein [Prevotellaceae bacterium]
MKKTSKPLLSRVMIAIGTALVACTFLVGYRTLNATERGGLQSEVPYGVTSPTVPERVEFAGQQIELLRNDLRERMDRELLSFTYMHSNTLLIIKRANRLFPLIEPILRENNLPDDLKYLAVIESNLQYSARSPAGAAGIWQFMPKTGRDYGLEVGENIDERYHTEKATRAACRYLREAYDKFGDWLCVAASYNGGQQRISSARQKQLVDKATDLWLAEETSRYLFRLLAAKTVMSHPSRYGFLLKSEQLYPPIPCTRVSVTTGIDNLAAFAKEHGIFYAQLKEANPWLRDTFLQNRSGRTYVLSIPTREGIYYHPSKIVPYNKEWVID